MKHLKFLLASLFIGLVFALLEVQIEGSSGWAANLPTWRKEVFFPIMGMWGKHAKPLTGYHLYLWLFSFSVLHFAFFLTKWSFKKELKLISFYILFSSFEGLLWFVVNPAFGWRSFRINKIPWYKEEWILGLPAEYWLRFSIASVVYFFSLEKKTNILDRFRNRQVFSKVHQV